MTRSRIIATAAEVMGVQGVDATTLDDVMSVSSVSKSQLYRHFAHKSALVRAVIESVGAQTIADERAPPLSTIGLTETQARQQGLNIKVAREMVANIVAFRRAYTVEETRGLMKFILDADTDLILGAAILSIDSQEAINTVALAMRQGVTATTLQNAIYSHPSTTEAFNDIFSKIVS